MSILAYAVILEDKEAQDFSTTSIHGLLVKCPNLTVGEETGIHSRVGKKQFHGQYIGLVKGKW
jgi:hypothetical protein